MLYVLALLSFGVALLLGTLDLVGVTPGAGGAVNLALIVAIGLLCAKAVANYIHHHHRHARQAHR